MKGRQQTLCLDQDTGITHTHTLSKKTIRSLDGIRQRTSYPNRISIHRGDDSHPSIGNEGERSSVGQAHLNYEG